MVLLKGYVLNLFYSTLLTIWFATAGYCFNLETQEKARSEAEIFLQSLSQQKSHLLRLKMTNLSSNQQKIIEKLVLTSLVFSRDIYAPKNLFYLTMTIRPFVSEMERALYNSYNLDDLTHGTVHHLNACYYLMNATQIFMLMKNPEWRSRNGVKNINNESLAEKVYQSSVMHATGRDRTVHRLLRSVKKEEIQSFFQNIDLAHIISKIYHRYGKYSNYEWKNKGELDPRVIEAKNFPQVFRLMLPAGQKGNSILFQTATTTYALFENQKILLSTGHIDQADGYIERQGKRLNVSMINFGDLITHQILKLKNVTIDFDLAKRFALDYMSADFSMAIVKDRDSSFFKGMKPISVETDPNIYACIYDEDIEFVGIGEYSNLYNDDLIQESDQKPRYYSSRVTFARPLKASNDPLKGRLSYRFSSFERLRSLFAPRNDLSEDVTGFEGLCRKGCSGASGMIFKDGKIGYSIVSILGQATDRIKKNGKFYNIHYPLLPYISVIRDVIKLADQGVNVQDYKNLTLNSFTKMLETFTFPEDSFEELLKQDLLAKISKLPPHKKSTWTKGYQTLVAKTMTKNSLENLIQFSRLFHKKGRL